MTTRKGAIVAFGFGLLSGQRAPDDPRSWEDVYRESIDLTVALETFGYDSVWTTEHHFVDDGYMPSLLVTSAALAAATTTIDIGTGVVLAPLHRPLRLAEDAATVQLISNGRLILGLGLGWSTTEFNALGVPMNKRGASMTEILQILPKAWTGEPFSWEGDVYTIPDLAVRPAPSTKIPVIVGGGVDAAVKRAVLYADGFFSNASPKRFAEQVAVAKEEMERIGRDPETFRWIYYAVMYPGPVDEIVDNVWHQIWKYSDMEDSAARSGPIAATPPLTDGWRANLSRRILGGSGDEIVAALGDIRSAAGVPIEWVARSHFSDISYARQVDIAGSLATEVLPHAPTD
ncbi:MAG: LLM class flavin-dependent oxidoreductase [Actinomycetota bacterium]